jgi:fatty-acyl-CoA synthase
MLARMLRLPADLRNRFDLSSLRRVVHAAAPCPVDVKRGIIDWWGPILDEYYSGTEGFGITYITSDEWLRHPGSVGRPILGEVHVVDDEGRELSVGEVGTVCFGDAGHARATFDDMGFIDAEGYLYLTDRRTHMIVSGGVNIYPREVEELLARHPAVDDVAVIGVPDDDFGEQVKALVQTATGVEGDDSLAADLLSFCHDHLAGFKCPRSIDFVVLPREPTGKLAKGPLRDRYWAGHTTRII